MARKKKYTPIEVPRKTPSNTPQWFDIIAALNGYSVDARKQWQEKGARTVSGWVVKAPNGNLLPSTFSVVRSTAMKKCLEPAMQRFNGIIPSLWSEWAKHGYTLVKVEWKIK